jgi:hypothetical protein
MLLEKPVVSAKETFKIHQFLLERISPPARLLAAQG